jgi:hypothetical protein
MGVSVTGISSWYTSLEPAVIPTAQVSSFTLQYFFRIMCDVPRIAVFCSESTVCFPGTVSKFFLKLLVTIPVATIITGTIVHFSFHIRCISIHKLLYLLLFYYLYKQNAGSSDIATTWIKILLHIQETPDSYFDQEMSILNEFFVIFLGSSRKIPG